MVWKSLPEGDNVSGLEEEARDEKSTGGAAGPILTPAPPQALRNCE